MIQYVCLLVYCLICVGQTYTFDRAEVKFRAISKTPISDFEFIGSGNGLSGTLNMTSGRFDFNFNLWTLKTGIRLRDDHMHEIYLETEKFPNAVFSGNVTQLKKDVLVAEGTFTIHGVKRPMTIRGFIENNTLIAKWPIRITDFNIEVPTQFIISKLKETLYMSVELELKP